MKTLYFLAAVIAGGCLASCSKPVAVQDAPRPQTLSVATTAAGPVTVNVMTYNILRGKNRDGVDVLSGISDLIETSGADVVMLQEVDKLTVASGNVDQMAWLAANTTGYPYYAFASHFAYDGGQYGVGILSKFPLSDTRNNRINVEQAGEADKTLAMLTARAELPGGRSISLACVHFSGDNKDEQAAETLDYLRYYNNAPVFLAGDLNSIPGSTPVNLLLNQFDDTEDRYWGPIANYYTFPAHTTPDSTYRKKIDFVLASKPHISQIVSRSVIKVPNNTRDHFPFLATVELKGSLFAEGNLLIERYGNGSALSGVTTQIFLDEYTTSGTLVRTLAVPTTSSSTGGVVFNRRLTGIGNSTHEGLMTLSRNGQSVSFMGYDLATGVTPPSPIPNRVAGLLTADGVLNTMTASSTNSGSTRCITSVDGRQFWYIGSGGNIRYMPMGLNGTASTDLGGPSGSRSVFLYNNNERLYLSTTIAGGPRIARVGTGSSLPVSGTPAIGAFPGYPATTTAPNQFVMFDTGSNNTPDILYVADDGTGEILKYTYSVDQWVAQGAVSVPGIKSITGKISGGTVTLYVTTIGTGSSLKTLTNAAGSTLTGATVTNIVTAPTNQVFKSVTFAPIF
ncbi:endonuclease/exonuclease/phosphatase family protein [Chitinophaga lutea]